MLSSEDKMEEMEIDNSDISQEEEKEKRAEWTPEEDFYMLSYITSYGPQNWSLVADYMNARFPWDKKSSKQCRERWYNKLDPAICHSPWTKQEEALLVLSHMKYKNRWCDISNALKGRHNNMIKNRFYSIFRKVKNKVRNNDLTYRTKLELFEMYYMIMVMEDYVANPLPQDEPKRKRGRDFMYTLIKDVDLKLLRDYKDALSKRSPLKAPLEQCLQKIATSVAVNHRRSNTQNIQLPKGSHAETQSALTPPLEEPMQNVKTPDSCPTVKTTSFKFTLPEPNTYSAKQLLTEDEKEFIIKHIFTPRKLIPDGVLYPQALYATPMTLENTGMVQSTVAKGGFDDFSKQELVAPSFSLEQNIAKAGTAFQPLH